MSWSEWSIYYSTIGRSILTTSGLLVVSVDAGILSASDGCSLSFFFVMLIRTAIIGLSLRILVIVLESTIPQVTSSSGKVFKDLWWRWSLSPISRNFVGTTDRKFVKCVNM